MSTSPKGKRGPKLKLNEDLIAKIIKAVKAGVYLETAAGYAGVSRDTLSDWLRKGRKQPKSIFGELIREVDIAWDEASVRDIMNIELCAHGRKATYVRDSNGKLELDGNGNAIPETYYIKPDWKASAWRISRREASQWGGGKMVGRPGDNAKSVSQTEPPADVVLNIVPKKPTTVLIELPDNGRDKKNEPV